MIARAVLALFSFFAGTTTAGAQADHVIVPQSRSVPLNGGSERVGISRVDAQVDVIEEVATTMLDIGIYNPLGRAQEVELLVPVPDRAIVRGFDFLGGAAEPTAELLPREHARSYYDEIVAKAKDPAILEFAGRKTVRTSVFPVPANGVQHVRLVYEHVLGATDDRVDFELPRSESLQACWLPWTLEVRIRSSHPISAVYSPSHDFEKLRATSTDVRLRLNEDAAREPGPFRFSYLRQRDGVNATLFATRDVGAGGGYFLLLAGLPAPEETAAKSRLGREVIVVLDTSGSMKGEKMEQAREAARQVIEGLAPGEAFNIIDYDTDVASFSARPVTKDDASIQAARQYLAGLAANGGTNLHRALMTALDQEHDERLLPLVLFLTDGLPTVGETDETTIRDAAQRVNRHERRIFTFGVGHDVNYPLLDHLASQSRGSSTYVQPGENTEEKVSAVDERLRGPVFASPELSVTDDAGSEADHLLRDVMPRTIPDLFEGDQLVLLGRYRGEAELTFAFRGNYLGEERSFTFRFDVAAHEGSFDFVPRLWASRRIGTLIEELRQSGADPTIANGSITADPRHAELAEEIYRLSSEFGILTEYTSFLALEGTDLTDSSRNLATLNTLLRDRLRRVRAGQGAANQALNTQRQMRQVRENRRNRYLNAEMKQAEVSAVQQIGGRAYYRRGSAWIDGRLARRNDFTPNEVVPFGSDRHRQLVDRLVGDRQQGALALDGDLLIEVEGKLTLLKASPAKEMVHATTP